ncbi:EAL domain-containing protein [Cellulomonas cellasea]|uniref:EAL domain-containing protein (Putative c-di-GMP-specific phosphodiesterase class I) n=1 Tax=Cellulomonas cellasea TaxID=43670 RepID=A0A7W4YCJ5_9CELL|nr:EAL domain-containing protein [Cellulomonas cellasea]MBB2923606.1 EAL domain-containing protein (putative c-di-GMP-specific phosphodiesterase class I) [Cellulomonas cellasea]
MDQLGTDEVSTRRADASAVGTREVGTGEVGSDEVGTGEGIAQRIDAVARAHEDGTTLEDACARLVHLLRQHVHMEVGWTSEFVGTEQVFRIVDVEPGRDGPAVGTRTSLNDAYCSRVLNGTMPALIPNARDVPAATWLDVTLALHIGSYLGVPLHAPDGTPNGMLCMISSGVAPQLDEHALTTARLVAQVIDDLHHRALGEGAARRERAALHAHVATLCAGDGRHAVYQPIVELRTGVAVAAEALTRFEASDRAPAGWFAAAHSVGLGRELEVAAARCALDALRTPGQVPPGCAIAVNLSPDLVVDALDELLDGVDVSRVLLELTEYAPVVDYDRLRGALDPHRAAGLRIAVDDTGAGYASLSHVLLLRPDVVKVDMQLVRGVDTDPVRQALVGALVRFCAVAGALVVAEGVETEEELVSLLDLGVDLGQGFFLEKPCREPRWDGLPHHARPLATSGG